MVFCTDSASLSAAPAAHDLVHRLRELLPEALDLERVRSLQRRMNEWFDSIEMEGGLQCAFDRNQRQPPYRVIIVRFDIIFLDYL